MALKRMQHFDSHCIYAQYKQAELGTLMTFGMCELTYLFYSSNLFYQASPINQFFQNFLSLCMFPVSIIIIYFPGTLLTKYHQYSALQKVYVSSAGAAKQTEKLTMHIAHSQ